MYRLNFLLYFCLHINTNLYAMEQKPIPSYLYKSQAISNLSSAEKRDYDLCP